MSEKTRMNPCSEICPVHHEALIFIFLISDDIQQAIPLNYCCSCNTKSTPRTWPSIKRTGQDDQGEQNKGLMDHPSFLLSFSFYHVSRCNLWLWACPRILLFGLSL